MAQQTKSTTKKKQPTFADFSGKQYWEGVGRRKTATARVRIYEGSGDTLLVNEKPLAQYFALEERQEKAIAPLDNLGLSGSFDVTCLVKGGGLQAQAEAIRLGLARALLEYNEEYRTQLRQLGYLTRDPRMRERKKPGLKRARRAPQWQKR